VLSSQSFEKKANLISQIKISKEGRDMGFLKEYTAIHPYWPVFMFLLIGTGFGIVTLIFACLVRPSKPDPEKLSTYECGMPLFMGASEKRFSIRFYIIAILFLLFDIEAVFLYPWAVVYKKIGLFGFVEMMLFIIILLVGYLYAWRKGALEWE
jgi:NADH-quinone oxidoreductase subunit A